MEFEYVIGEKGNRKLLFRSHLFVKDKVVGDKVYWKCEKFCKFRCKARVVMKEGEIMKVNLEHSHVGRAEEIERNKIMERLRVQAAESRDTPTYIISTLVPTNQVVAAEMPTVSSLKRTINNIRRRFDTAPTTPSTACEIILPEGYKLTERGEQFIIFDSGMIEDRMLVFSTHRNMEVLRRSNHWYGDGTFKTVPHLFEQLYTIHGMEGHNATPLLYALLPNKTHSTYCTLLNKIKQLYPGVAPHTFLSDFESGMIKAIRDTFPQVWHRGCFFHFSQSIFRKVQALGFKQQYESDVIFASKIRLLPALAFVPISRLVECFELVCGIFPEEAQSLIDYFEDTWIGRPDHRVGRRPPLYAHIMWNCFQVVVDGLPKTNNGIEGWHRGFQYQISGDHPNIWKFLDAMKREQNLSDFRMDQLESGQEPPHQRRRYKDSAARLRQVVLTWQQDTDVVRYLHSIGTNIAF